MRAVLTATMMLALSGAAYAKEPSIWVKCDGLPKPEGVGTTAARILAVSTTMGLFGLPESQREEPAATAAAGVDACTQALAELTADQAWARRVNMLRARALHRVEANDSDTALTDLQAANTLAKEHGDELFFQRSVGVAATLFEAAMHAKKGQQADAERLAIAASDQRPYSYQIASMSAAILALDGNMSDGERRVLNRVGAFNPRGLAMRARLRERSGDPAGAADDYAILLGYHVTSLSQDIEEVMDQPLRDPIFLGRAALASARAGRLEQADALLAELKAIPVLPEKVEPGAAPPAKKRDQQAQLSTFARNKMRNALRNAALKLAPLTEATLLERRGKAEESIALLFQPGTITDDSGALDLLKRLSTNPATAAKAPPAMVAQLEALVKQTNAAHAAELDILKYAKALPSLEQEGGGNTYKAQARGIFGTNALSNGYARDKNDKAASPVREITFTGGSSVPISEELALTRAVELAREANASGFVVEKRQDYQRYYVTSYGGVETSRTPTGFQTALTVRFTDKNSLPAELAAQKDRVVDVDAAWTSLSGAFPPPAPAKK